MNKKKKYLLQVVFLIFMFCSSSVLLNAQQKQMNIIFILADDHRYDAMGFMKKIQGLQTPGMDMMAKEGAHIKNAFVSTALCSPSRASILTGQYAHTQSSTMMRHCQKILCFFLNICKRTVIKPLSSANGTWAIPTTSRNLDLTTG